MLYMAGQEHKIARLAHQFLFADAEKHLAFEQVIGFVLILMDVWRRLHAGYTFCLEKGKLPGRFLTCGESGDYCAPAEQRL